jgi:ribonuclease HI
MQTTPETTEPIIYYTDGSCEPNPGAGGFAVIREMEPHILGHEADSTNIRMEGKALIAAIKDAGGAPCVINTDSDYEVVDWLGGQRLEEKGRRN